MFSKNKFVLMALAISTLPSIAQNDLDVLRYSLLNPTASARATALGGAVGSMGADATNLSTNPAGLGISRGSQFMFTPLLNTSYTKTEHLQNPTEDSRSSFSIGNLSYFTSQRTENDKGVLRINYGISINRIANFNRDYTLQADFEGVDLAGNSNAYVNRFTDLANGFEPSVLGNFTDGLAYDTFVINQFDGTTEYYNLFNTGEMNQFQRVRERGGISDIGIGGAVNIDERFFIGASLAITSLRFEQQITVTEKINEQPVEINPEFDLREYTFNERFSVTGSAANIKIGGVAKINDYLRAGIAWHSGSVFELTDVYTTNIEARFFNGDVNRAISPEGTFNYRLRIPGRIIGSATVIFGKKGLFNVEYERENYNRGELRRSRIAPMEESFNAANQAVRDFYQPGNIFRAGAEIKIYGPIMMRAGYVLMESPVKENFKTFEQDRQIFSGGIGFNGKKFIVDFTYYRALMQTDHFMYAAAVPPTKLNNVVNGFMLSLGYRIK